MFEAYPLVCPFCDELAYPSKKMKRRILPDRIYTPRECIMGHEFISVETVPENQAELVQEMREFKKEELGWKRHVISESKRVKEGYKQLNQEQRNVEQTD